MPGMDSPCWTAVVGDLGQVGSELLREVMEKEGCPLEGRQNDCGLMIYDRLRRAEVGGGDGGGPLPKAPFDEQGGQGQGFRHGGAGRWSMA